MADQISFSLGGARGSGMYRAAFDRAPEVMLRNLAQGAEQGADVVAVAARRGVKRDIFGTLRNSIHAARLQGLPAGTVGSEARPAVHYAPYVEHGTGPAAGRPRYYPNPESLLQHLTHSRGMRGFKWAGRAGSVARSTQEYDLWWRSRAWAWSIYMKGTKPSPFMGPAVERSRPRVLRLLRAAATNGVREAFSG